MAELVPLKVYPINFKDLLLILCVLQSVPEEQCKPILALFILKVPEDLKIPESDVLNNFAPKAKHTCSVLVLKAPNKNCSRRHFIFLLSSF